MEGKKNSGEYTESTPAFSATHHAAQREVQVCTLITYSRVWINRVKVASPARGLLNRGNEYFPPFAPENLVSPDRVV